MLKLVLVTSAVWTAISFLFVWRLARYAARRGLTPERLPSEIKSAPPLVLARGGPAALHQLRSETRNRIQRNELSNWQRTDGGASQCQCAVTDANDRVSCVSNSRGQSRRLANSMVSTRPSAPSTTTA